MRKNKVTQLLILIAILVIGGLTIGTSFMHKEAKPAKVGNPAPAFALQQLEGSTEKFTAYKGKAIVLNFWGSFCQPCVREMPLLAHTAAESANANIQFIGVNLGESKLVVANFIRQTSVAYPIFLDTDLKVAERYGVISYPTTFFVDAKGVIREKVVGELDEKTLQAGLAKISK
jgi:peroxiredoxin